MGLVSVPEAARLLGRSEADIEGVVTRGGLTRQPGPNGSPANVDLTAIAAVLDLESLKKSLDEVQVEVTEIRKEVEGAKKARRKGFWEWLSIWLAIIVTAFGVGVAIYQWNRAGTALRVNNAIVTYNNYLDAVERARADMSGSRGARINMIEDRLWIARILKDRGVLDEEIWSKFQEPTCQALRRDDGTYGSSTLDAFCAGSSAKEGGATSQPSPGNPQSPVGTTRP